MARGRRSFAGRFISGIRNIFRREPEQPTRAQPERERLSPREAAERERRETTGAPQYDPNTNKWSQISDHDWRQMQRLMDRQIREGANYNDALTAYTWNTEDERRSLKPRDRERLYIDAYPPNQRYSLIIDTLESGEIAPEEMLRLLEESDRLARQYAQGDNSGARRRWESRNRLLPDALFFYHWGF